MRYLAILLGYVLLPCFAMGQYAPSQERPSWTDGYFADKQNSYIEVISAISYSEEDAREKALEEIIKRRTVATGLQSTVAIQNGNIIVRSNDDLNVKARIIDEYCDHLGPGQYRVYLLVQTAKNPEFQYESVAVTKRYGFSPRVFVPGMAQIYKGQNIRGALFITGEVVMIGGIIAFEGLRTSYKSKINSTHDVKTMQAYADKANNMQNIRNGFIAGAAAVYVWNIIDGIVAKGTKHVVVGESHLDFSPYADPYSAGLTLSMKF